MNSGKVRTLGLLAIALTCVLLVAIAFVTRPDSQDGFDGVPPEDLRLSGVTILDESPDQQPEIAEEEARQVFARGSGLKADSAKLMLVELSVFDSRIPAPPAGEFLVWAIRSRGREETDRISSGPPSPWSSVIFRDESILLLDASSGEPLRVLVPARFDNLDAGRRWVASY